MYLMSVPPMCRPRGTFPYHQDNLFTERNLFIAAAIKFSAWGMVLRHTFPRMCSSFPFYRDEKFAAACVEKTQSNLVFLFSFVLTTVCL